MILRHTLATQTWDTLPVTLPAGKSDFATLQLPNSPDIGVPVMPNMNSGMTRINPGTCATNNWRNLFNTVTDGKKVVWRTNAQQHPWLQLDLNQEVNVIKVRFESGPVGGQEVEVRVRVDPVESGQAADSLLTGDGSEVCGGSGNTIDGTNTMDVCCSKRGRYVTIQATSADNVPLGEHISLRENV